MRFPRQIEHLGLAALLLSKIRQDPDDLSTVLTLQRFLLRQVITAEHRIKRLKSARARMQAVKRKGSTRGRSIILKALLSKAASRIQDLHQLIFLWKCFGDGIACVYQSSYSLKHLYFDEKYEVKSDPGFMLGKIGFMNEYRFLRRALAKNVPAVLSDLTNVIRHGDVCLMGGADPLPWEIKSSANTNKRVKKQQEQLKELLEFFTNDYATNFRGGLNAQRIEVPVPVVSYEDQINECLTKAQQHGTAVVTPELGLTYLCGWTVAGKSDALPDLLGQHQTPTTLTVFLSPEPTWQHHRSFTVALSPANTVLFMQEKFTCAVLIDLAVAKQLLDERALEPVILMDGISAIQIAPRVNKQRGNFEGKGFADDWENRVGVFRLSEQHFLRVATQFESLQWFAENLAQQIEAMRSERPQEAEVDYLSLKEVPKDWLTAKDCYAEPSGD